MPARYPKESSSQALSPYPLAQEINSDGIAYTTFSTDTGVRYVMYFISDADYLAGASFADKAYSFILDVAHGDWRKGADSRIRLTVVAALETAFAVEPALVISYACRTEDQLGRMRVITFGKWLNARSADYTRLGYSEDNAFAGTFFRNDHPHITEIIERFDIIYRRKDLMQP